MENKKFGDLKVGDTVWRENYKDWQLESTKVIKVEENPNNFSYIRIYLSSGLNFITLVRNYHYDLMGIWSDKGKAIEYMTRQANIMEPRLIKKIDSLISQYDALQKFMIEYGQNI